MINQQEHLKELLEEKVLFYNQSSFILNDPVSIPHQFDRKEDIEISGFLSATLAWGQRITIIRKGHELIKRMDYEPFDFISNSSARELNTLADFVHRTFQGDDCVYFVFALQQIYKNEGGLEKVFGQGYQENQSIKMAIHHFREIFFSFDHLHRTRKHLADPMSGSAAKRINMYLRWMVRQDDKGVDFGIWKNFSPADLMCPLDLHSGNIARRFGLLTRKQNDWYAVEELTANLRKLDPSDPVKYDFALFGTGVNEKLVK